MSLNLLYDFIDIGIKKKPSIDFLKRIKLPFVPDQIFANKEEVLLYRRNKYINEKYSSSRVRITTDSHFLEELPLEPRFASLATWKPIPMALRQSLKPKLLLALSLLVGEEIVLETLLPALF